MKIIGLKAHAHSSRIYGEIYIFRLIASKVVVLTQPGTLLLLVSLGILAP
jgi:hypothetical protein